MGISGLCWMDTTPEIDWMIGSYTRPSKYGPLGPNPEIDT
jgi:hypothetical protein